MGDYGLAVRYLTAGGWRWSGAAPLPLADGRVVLACSGRPSADSDSATERNTATHALCVVDAAGTALRALPLRGAPLAADAAAATASVLVRGVQVRDGEPRELLGSVALADGATTALALPLCGAARACAGPSESASVRAFGTVEAGTCVARSLYALRAVNAQQVVTHARARAAAAARCWWRSAAR